MMQCRAPCKWSCERFSLSAAPGRAVLLKGQIKRSCAEDLTEQSLNPRAASASCHRGCASTSFCVQGFPQYLQQYDMSFRGSGPAAGQAFAGAGPINDPSFVLQVPRFAATHP